jgi:hypothetical protein
MFNIVGNGRWQCRNCEQAFEKRGQRDSHQRKEHQKFVNTHDRSHHQTTIVRTTSKDFVCSCGKKFAYSQSLHRHVKNCSGATLMVGGGIKNNN